MTTNTTRILNRLCVDTLDDALDQLKFDYNEYSDTLMASRNYSTRCFIRERLNQVKYNLLAIEDAMIRRFRRVTTSNVLNS